MQIFVFECRLILIAQILRLSFLRASVSLLVFCSLVVSAQEIEEVIITAEQPTDALLNDLVSVSALSAEKLADAGIENVEDVAAYVPNLVLSQTETGTSIVIRGIGAGVNQGFDQSVGLYIDGVPLPRANMSRAPFLDLANVQVLRGPQYVLDGNYSIAGSVHMLSNLSLDEFGAGIDVNYIPSQNDQRVLLTAGMPFNDVFAARIAVQSKRGDGYVENVTRGEDGPQTEELVGRIVLGFNPTEDLSFKFKIERGSFDTFGRAAEIIYDEKTPSLHGQFADADGDGKLENFERRRPDPSNNKVSSLYVTDIDRLHGALGTQYSAAALFNQSQWWFSNISYLDKLASAYTGASAAVPVGLQDATLNYKRGADAEEYSLNDSVNYTLNGDYWINEHKFSFTTSYVEYDFVEQIDSDFTAAPIFVTSQEEHYEQIFQRIDYVSPEGEFLEFKAGASYLSSKLSFADATVPALTITSDDTQGLDPSNDLFPTYPDGSVSTIAEPLRIYFGGFGVGHNVLPGLERYHTDRQFDQDADVSAAYLQTKINWSEVFRTVIGARYTHSNKSAVRDLVFLDANGNNPAVSAEFPVEDFNQYFIGMAQLLGVHQHSDRAGNTINSDPTRLTEPAIRGDVREEKLLPSLSLEWDITDNFSSYVAVSKANKLGGFDARANTVPTVRGGWGAPGGSFYFKDEDATSYDVGINWFLPNGIGEIRTVAFMNEFRNLQISRFDGKSGFNVTNAGAATSKGIELEGLFQITDAFNIQYSMAWIDFEFDEFKLGSCHLGRRPDYFVNTRPDVNPFVTYKGKPLQPGQIIPIRYVFDRDFLDITKPWVGDSFRPNSVADFDNSIIGAPGLCDFKGQSNQFVAEWQGTFTFNYERDVIGLGIFKPTLDILYNDGYETTVSQDPLAAQESYVQLNGRVALASFEDTWTVALTGENLTNQKIVTYANETPLGPRLQGARGFTAFTRSPRAIGINVRYNFY